MPVSPTPDPSAAAASSGSDRVDWLFFDLNSYFASVEQQMRPELRGVPVIVVPVVTDSTCAIAASTEAKAFGIRTGTPVDEARQRCPDVHLVLASHDRYVEYHHKIIEEVERHIPVHNVASIDEMACKLAGRQREPAHALALAQQIKSGLEDRIGDCITCSIGLAPNRFLAKVATDLQKPDGLVLLRMRDLPERLRDLKLRDLPGIGLRMEKRLLAAQIKDVWELWHCEPKRVRAAWGGIDGERFWMKLHGVELPDHAENQKTIGHSHVMAPELRPPSRAVTVARRLLLKAASRLRRAGCTARRMDISVRMDRAERLEWSATFPPASDSYTLLAVLSDLWIEVMKVADGRPIKKTGLTLSGLAPATSVRQLELFDNMPGLPSPDRDRKEKLSRVMDELNQRYGRDTISLGLPPDAARSFSGSKIAFNRIPDLEEFKE